MLGIVSDPLLTRSDNPKAYSDDFIIENANRNMIYLELLRRTTRNCSHLYSIFLSKQELISYLRHDIRSPTKWNVRPTKAQTSLCILAD